MNSCLISPPGPNCMYIIYIYVYLCMRISVCKVCITIPQQNNKRRACRHYDFATESLARELYVNCVCNLIIICSIKHLYIHTQQFSDVV